MRPLLARAVAEHEALAAEAGAERYFSRNGWLKLYRTDARVRGAQAPNSKWRRGSASPTCRSIAMARWRSSRRSTAYSATPCIGPARCSVDNPLALTRAYAARFAALGGLTLERRRAHAASRRVASGASIPHPGRSMPRDVVIALGPWAPDVLVRSASGCRSRSSAAITGIFARRATPRSAGRCSMPTNGYLLAPMEQGIRITTGVEFAARDARRRRCSSIACCRRRERCFRSASRSSRSPGSGRGRALPNSRPVIGRAPGQRGLWLAFGHGALGSDARPGDRPADRRDDDRRDAVLRSDALRRGAVRCSDSSFGRADVLSSLALAVTAPENRHIRRWCGRRCFPAACCWTTACPAA